MEKNTSEINGMKEGEVKYGKKLTNTSRTFLWMKEGGEQCTLENNIVT